MSAAASTRAVSGLATFAGIAAAVIAFGAIPFFGSDYLMDAVLTPFLALALAAVGLNGFENRPIGTLSGGQTQRMLFARVLLQDARLIVLDEPFNAIDAKTTADLLALVKRWNGEGRTVLAALHDLDMVRNNFPETLLLARGPSSAGSPTTIRPA